jgi:hypothetical protein
VTEISFLKAILLTNLWAGLFILDVYLTARAEKEYLKNAKEILFYEAGYQLEDPTKSVTEKKPSFTYRSILLLITSSIAVILFWLDTVEFWGHEGIYSFVLGGLLLTIVAVDIRHIQNIFLYSNTGTPNGIRGRLEYPGWIGYRLSGLEMFAFAVLFLIVALILPNWFLAGGSFGCALIGIRHWIWSNRYLQSPPAEQE